MRYPANAGYMATAAFPCGTGLDPKHPRNSYKCACSVLSKSYGVMVHIGAEVVGFFTPGRGLTSVLIARIPMLDVVFLAAGTIFFLLTAAYDIGCENL
jgi:hypothetical protein